MVTCPRGHSSAATDYCDECGAPIGGTTPAAVPTGSPAATPASPPATAGDPCPDCGTARAGRFCEVCGHDFLAESPAPTTTAPAASASVEPASVVSTGDAATGSGSAAAGSGSAAPASPAPAAAGAAPAAATGSGTAGAGWRVTVSADREYYERMRAASGPDAPQVAFPAYCPQRRFELSGAQLLIGRRSRSRGVEPDVDLTGPPEDAGVSHMHALLVAGADGRWSVVDLDSANGTYVNAGTDQIAAHTPVPLDEGDTVHVGAWTTLTVQRG